MRTKPTTRPNVYTLTPFERKCLDGERCGLKRQEIATVLDSHIDSVSQAIRRAVDKERLAIVFDKDQRHCGVSSKSKAHGYVRMRGTK
jgi:hypothetical protein